jgi:hypothetical protein
MINQKDFINKWRKIMDSPDGELVMAALFEQYILRTSHTPGDPYQTAFNEGQRDVVNFLINLVREDN